MVNMTFSVPEQLHKLMRKHSDVKWAEVARSAIWMKAKDLELLDKLTSKSTMTLKDVQELDRTIKDSVWGKISKDAK